mmetsp:Transcript_28048/g.60767  ORF Transcript_28048/g.60767 Transcript_28048/m.60767 type:complete len:232 (-) Transcript_28048:1167-1862(-)
MTGLRYLNRRACRPPCALTLAASPPHLAWASTLALIWKLPLELPTRDLFLLMSVYDPLAPICKSLTPGVRRSSSMGAGSSISSMASSRRSSTSGSSLSSMFSRAMAPVPSEWALFHAFTRRSRSGPLAALRRCPRFWRCSSASGLLLASVPRSSVAWSEMSMSSSPKATSDTASRTYFGVRGSSAERCSAIIACDLNRGSTSGDFMVSINSLNEASVSKVPRAASTFCIPS